MVKIEDTFFHSYSEWTNLLKSLFVPLFLHSRKKRKNGFPGRSLRRIL
jgi:hypothetical protein